MTTNTSTTTVKKVVYTPQSFLFMTLDPVHIGAGGYRLGRVDMTITREPGTNLPKIPGTSLAGAARSYAALRYGKRVAAGQHKNLKKEQKLQCPIIYTFGTATDTGSEQTQSEEPTQAGTVSIGDARILFFPVISMAGPIWVSTAEVMKEAWGEQCITELPTKPTDELVVTSLSWNSDQNNKLNLGWLMFTAAKGLTIAPPNNIGSRSEWNAIAGRVALVTQKLFSQIVNSNLEVRTSVSINPDTGAAEPRALFTYEAIPRAAWLWCDVIEDDYRRDNNGISLFPKTEKQCKVKVEKNEENKEIVSYEDNAGDLLEPPGTKWVQPLDVVNSGMSLIEYLGIGGMGTRGFGRMRLVARW